jgi:hypothetical protein
MRLRGERSFVGESGQIRSGRKRLIHSAKPSNSISLQEAATALVKYYLSWFDEENLLALSRHIAMPGIGINWELDLKAETNYEQCHQEWRVFGLFVVIVALRKHFGSDRNSLGRQLAELFYTLLIDAEACYGATEFSGHVSLRFDEYFSLLYNSLEPEKLGVIVAGHILGDTSAQLPPRTVDFGLAIDECLISREKEIRNLLTVPV